MKYRKSGLSLSSGIFQSLYNELIRRFEERYSAKADNFMDYQLFGYGNYDLEKPNLRQYILETTDITVNGKYLYNKYLEWVKGKSPIRFTREYTNIYFNAIGFKNLSDFLNNSDLPEKAIKEQLSIDTKKEIKNIEELYIGYFLNEEDQIAKSKLIISKNSKTVKWILGYRENGILIEYIYPGEIKYQENGMSFFFDNSKNELDRSLFVGFYFDKHVRILPYLVGSYSGYDRDRKPAMGVVLFERKNNWDELEFGFNQLENDNRILEYIRNKRWLTSGTLPQSLDDLSKSEISGKTLLHSSRLPALNVLFHFHGTFLMCFLDQNTTNEPVTLEIDQSGRAKYEYNSFRYSGEAFLSEGSILSIQISHCNNIPHSAQVLAFVGRYPSNKIAWMKGTWHGLDETLSISTREIVIINQPSPISQSKLKEIHQSEKKICLK